MLWPLHAFVHVVFIQVNKLWQRNEQSGRPPPTALSRRTKVDPNSCLEHGERSPWQHP